MRRNVWGRGCAERGRVSPNAAVGTALRHSGNTQHSRIRVASLSTFVAHGPSIRGRKCSSMRHDQSTWGQVGPRVHNEAVDNRERRDLLDLEQQEEEEDVQQDEQQRDERHRRSSGMSSRPSSSRERGASVE